jgi:hypothetical protein
MVGIAGKCSTTKYTAISEQHSETIIEQYPLVVNLPAIASSLVGSTAPANAEQQTRFSDISGETPRSRPANSRTTEATIIIGLYSK